MVMVMVMLPLASERVVVGTTTKATKGEQEAQSSFVPWQTETRSECRRPKRNHPLDYAHSGEHS